MSSYSVVGRMVRCRFQLLIARKAIRYKGSAVSSLISRVGLKEITGYRCWLVLILKLIDRSHRSGSIVVESVGCWDDENFVELVDLWRNVSLRRYIGQTLSSLIGSDARLSRKMVPYSHQKKVKHPLPPYFKRLRDLYSPKPNNFGQESKTNFAGLHVCIQQSVFL